MQILVVSPFPPHPTGGGGRIRLWEMVRHLGSSHRVTVVCFARRAHEGPLALKRLRTVCDDIIIVELGSNIDSAASGLPREVVRYSSCDMRVTLERQRRKKFDVVILEHIFMAQYRNIFSDSLIVLHEHNIESSVLAQFAELKCSASLRESETLAAQVFADAAEESERLRAYEDAVWHDVDLRVTVSEQDKSVIDRRCPKGDTIVVPNGVAVDAVPFLPLAAPGTVLFMGTLDYYPNVDAIYFLVEHVLPLISTDVTMRIAGRNPSAGVRRLSHSSRIEVIPFPPRMEDIAADCRLVVVPLRIGGGSRLRIPHAFAMGRPIVSTRLGCAGYDVTAGQHLLTADTAAEFAEAVDVLMTDHALAAHLRQRARRLADRKLRWDALFGPLGDTITALAS